MPLEVCQKAVTSGMITEYHISENNRIKNIKNGVHRKCLHFKVKCRHFPHSILNISSVCLTKSISK